jgi:xanthine/uracil permease
MKDIFNLAIELSIGGAIGFFTAVMFCSLSFDPLSYHEATFLAGSSIVPCFAGWFIGSIIYSSLRIKKYFRLVISVVVGTIIFFLLYYYKAEPVNGVTVLSIDLSKAFFPQLFGITIGVIIGLSLVHVLLKKFVPKYNEANSADAKIR